MKTISNGFDTKLIGASVGTLLFSALILKDALNGGEDPVSMTIFGVVFAFFGLGLGYASFLPKEMSGYGNLKEDGLALTEAEDA